MKRPPMRTLIAAALFILIWLAVAGAAPTTSVAVVLGILMLTVFLFAFEVVGVDVAAVSVLVLLGLISHFGVKFGLAKPLVPMSELFSGFSSNAVISIIAVMIIGAGLDKTGLMGKVAGTILKYAGRTEARIIPAISGTVGFISSFMQNVGAAALFLPVVSRIAARTGLAMSRLLMPMGFCAILGGTITMVGSSPLILLNDLILASNKAIPVEHQMQTWSLFAVTPIGLALLSTGIIYFVVAGRFVLPGKAASEMSSATDAMDYYQQLYGLNYAVYEMFVPAESPVAGKFINDIEGPNRLRCIAIMRGSDDLRMGPARDIEIKPGSVLGILGAQEQVRAFVAANGLALRPELETFAEQLAPTKAGIAEVVIPPGSDLIGKSARDVWMRKVYGISMSALHRGGKTLGLGEGIRDMPLQAGDALVVHTSWDALARLEKNRNFVVVTTEYPHEELRPHKVRAALGFFALTLGLILLTDTRLSLALMTGAIGMILAGVLRIEEAYQAVSWKSVFLLASLIPLGLAVETSGTAAWIAQQTLALLGGTPIWVVQLAIVILATCFTLVMSNVGATVLLVPLAVNIAIGAGANPAVFALTVALATSNSFFLPTHQVNALIMGPAGYRVADFMRAGGIMTVLFITVLMVMLNIVY
ncbi:MAG: SLC13 family permease [Sterolibacteriaceae bacterium]|uniref:SLC13 family permease n=1 Tax=Sulfuritalea sp. TaxID=2480090 RepID=UPI001A4B9DB1|nr:SLC13 family permease [Sulfuritalea sp.]MBL8480103.1 SLC13 family permease [Sterolibacteriaceae bacterium]MBN8475080.1 SLC13 family permease [Sulfuritalea sp.]